MYLKVHSTPGGEVVAVCDAVLVGKVLSQGKRKLDLEKYASFYVGERVSPASAIAALRTAPNANIVGKKSLEAAKAAGLDVSGSIKIGGVPHLQLYRI